MSTALLLTTLFAIPVIYLSVVTTTAAAAAVVNSNYDAAVTTTTSFPRSIADVGTDAHFTRNNVETAAMLRNDRKLLQRSRRSRPMQWSDVVVDGEVTPVGYFRRRRETNMFEEVVSDWWETAPLSGVRLRRSLNIFGHDGGDTRRQRVAMLYSVADRKFVQIEKNGSAMTVDRQESIHAVMNVLFWCSMVTSPFYPCPTPTRNPTPGGSTSPVYGLILLQFTHSGRYLCLDRKGRVYTTLHMNDADKLAECVWHHEIVMHKNDVYYSYKYPENDQRSSSTCLSQRWYLGVKQTGNELRSYRTTADTCSRLPGSRGVIVLTPPIRRRTLFIQRWLRQPINGNMNTALLPVTVPQLALDARPYALLTTSVTSQESDRDRSKVAVDTASDRHSSRRQSSTRNKCTQLLQRQRAAKTAGVQSTGRHPCPLDDTSIRHRKHRLLRRDQEPDANVRLTTRCQNLLRNGCASQKSTPVRRRRADDGGTNMRT